MDNILHYWWLIFLLPVFGGIIRSTFGGGGSKRRRVDRPDRRAQIPQQEQLPHPVPENFVSPGQYPSPQYAYPGAPSQQPARTPGEDPEAQRLRAVKKLISEHEEANKQWLDYELDVSKLIDYPMMSDVREPLTADFLRAKRIADRLAPESPEEIRTDEQLVAYREAVRNFEVSFELAEREARRIKHQHFDAEERQRLSTARRLLNMAMDEAATASERQLAYQRVRKELDGLLLVPDSAIAALEASLQKVQQPHLNFGQQQPQSAQISRPE